MKRNIFIKFDFDLSKKYEEVKSIISYKDGNAVWGTTKVPVHRDILNLRKIKPLPGFHPVRFPYYLGQVGHGKLLLFNYESFEVISHLLDSWNPSYILVNATKPTALLKYHDKPEAVHQFLVKQGILQDPPKTRSQTKHEEESKGHYDSDIEDEDDDMEDEENPMEGDLKPVIDHF